METETLDKLYLEWAQFTTARTFRELRAASQLRWLAACDRPVSEIQDRLREIAKELSDG